MSYLDEMTHRDRAVNSGAHFLPALDETGGRGFVPPAVELAGARAYLFTQDGALVVKLDFEHADPEVFDVYPGDDGTPAVPVAFSIGTGPVYEALPPGEPGRRGRHRKDGA
jgi:hypothetical protein